MWQGFSYFSSSPSFPTSQQKVKRCQKMSLHSQIQLRLHSKLRNVPLFMPSVHEEKKNGHAITAAKPRIGGFLPDMLDELWHQKGYTLLYETSKQIGPHYDMVQLECVLGIFLLMLLYSNVTGTIPV
eukprot:3068838-Rhodomonas_salina.1